MSARRSRGKQSSGARFYQSFVPGSYCNTSKAVLLPCRQFPLTLRCKRILSTLRLLLSDETEVSKLSPPTSHLGFVYRRNVAFLWALNAFQEVRHGYLVLVWSNS